ncbi:hypothetical protein KDX01_05005 [Burkholderia vietnamiensis]|nr:hypothetical protein [Burkholderia vietnamiensis]
MGAQRCGAYRAVTGDCIDRIEEIVMQPLCHPVRDRFRVARRSAFPMTPPVHCIDRRSDLRLGAQPSVYR